MEDKIGFWIVIIMLLFFVGADMILTLFEVKELNKSIKELKGEINRFDVIEDTIDCTNIEISNSEYNCCTINYCIQEENEKIIGYGR